MHMLKVFVCYWQWRQTVGDNNGSEVLSVLSTCMMSVVWHW